ncbi:hypothetical protein SI65_06367 [Aspergillus cristatus]|uniref:Helicase n=1 Tax=Aspergillus cristatus TaxID=573508 RepID=A0A1E3BDM9_ASPCR|nr:hypothetical protein SI65_06367 [Aspergillus cristatus]
MEGWYSSLDSRSLDLVSDYAGRELFCLEGDSLVLECLDDPALDFEDGFQLLHAVYMVERFLSKLVSTKCNFHVIFFDENRDLASLAASKDVYRSKYKLAREVIYQHLKTYLQKGYPDIQVHQFPAVNSPDFQQHIQTYSVYFAMCHNGALRRKNVPSVEPMLKVIANIMDTGLDVAVINEIEWRDIKVITRVIQARSLTPDSLSECTQSFQSLAISVDDNQRSNMSMREALTLAALSRLLLETPDEETKGMAGRVLFHLACLKSLSLNERRLMVQELPDPESHGAFLDRFCQAANAILRSLEWNNTTKCGWENDIHDLIDGRVLRSCVLNTAWTDRETDLSSQLESSYNTIMKCYQDISEFVHNQASNLSGDQTEIAKSGSANDPKVSMALLPFQNKVFDAHLASVRVAVDDSHIETYKNAIRDNRHWHNGNQLGPKRPINSPQRPYNKWRNPNIWKQIRFRDMGKYAMSLTNAKGIALEPQHIISPELRKAQAKGKISTKSSKGKKFAEENEMKTLAREDTSWIASWKNQVKKIEAMEPRLQIEECQSYIEKLDNRKGDLLEPEARLYLLSLLIIQYQGSRETEERVGLAIETWNQVRILRKKVVRMTLQCYQEFQSLCNKLQVPDVPHPSSTQSNRPLSFPSRAESIKSEQLGAPLNFQQFQMLHCGPLMDRQTGAKPDERVPFEPDKWQRDVLDELDQNNSLFVVAPTSAGKTFISFHAISKVLQEDDTGVLIYVAPTKALVNQIAAEIHARFTKKYPSNSGQSVWAIHTRDIRFNDPMKCQVLVTVPHMLQIMLLSPANAKTWAPRVKCIVFDEIHSIGQADDGLVWEQLLLLAPCRIIALSATVGNPTEFADWLSVTQKSLGIDLKLVQYGQRYSDLRKYFYTPPKKFKFQGLSRTKHKGLLESELVQGLHPIHPVTSLRNEQRQMTEDLSLEPRDCYVLWETMVKHSSAEFPVPETLRPENRMPSFIRRSDVFEWERCLKDHLATWMINPQSPFNEVRAELDSKFSSSDRLPKKTATMEKDDMCDSVFPLLVNLHQQNALPALLFNYERMACEQIAESVLKKLRAAEGVYKDGTAWNKKMAEYQKYQASKAKKAHEAGKRKSSQNESNPDPAEYERHPFDGFDPDRPLEQFSFAGIRGQDWEKLKKDIDELKRFNINPVLLEALTRGIGVHHAGLNKRYRHFVEGLFRRGFLRVVVATGTLALGINMPCSTVVFCGDSPFLTALNYRQASGRAGRRGFDLLGNVIFHGISLSKAYQLISSRLPDLNGHFPITTSLVLRLCILLHNSDESPYAVRAINSLLAQPRLCLGGVDSRDKVLHHLRFSIEYLRRQKLLGRHGEPIYLARSVAHLYYTENSAFVFHALLREGYFETVCRANQGNTEQKLRTLMIVMSHLFGRKSLGKRYEKLLKNKEDIKSPSAVKLPDIPPEAAEIMHKHHNEILKTYTAYVSTYIDQHLQTPETNLPLTGLSVGGAGNPPLSQTLGSSSPNLYRSPFVGLSGHSDDFTSIKDLCQTVRSEVFLEESVIPHLTVYPDGDMPPLNAYLYDFFCHGNLQPLEVANHISRSDAWFLLNNFSLILATIIVALESYLDPSIEERGDVEEPMGAGDHDGDDSEEDEVGDVKSDGEQVKEQPIDTKKSPSKQSPDKAKPKPAPIRKFNDDEEDDDELLDNWDDGSCGEEIEHDETDNSDEPEKENLVVSKEVLKAFKELKDKFDEKFHEIFA